jgi:hypothetical protein
MTKKHDDLAASLKSFVSGSYPDMKVVVTDYERDTSRLALFFTEERFSLLYPLQRYHYLAPLIPREFQDSELQHAVWHELAPGESPSDLVYPDPELIELITPDVMEVIGRHGFFAALDDLLSPRDTESQCERCHGDFRHSKAVLEQRGFDEQERFDVLHVLMAQGGHCDCEILYNVAPENRLKSEYWIARSAGLEPHDPHRIA